MPKPSAMVRAGDCCNCSKQRTGSLSAGSLLALLHKEMVTYTAQKAQSIVQHTSNRKSAEETVVDAIPVDCKCWCSF